MFIRHKISWTCVIFYWVLLLIFLTIPILLFRSNLPKGKPISRFFFRFRGVYFTMVMQLDMNVSDPAKNLHSLKLMIKNSCWLYLRNIRHFQLYPTVLLNRTTFHFEVSMTVIRLTRSMGITETHPRFKLIYCLTKWFNSSLVHWINLLKYDHSRRS